MAFCSENSTPQIIVLKGHYYKTWGISPNKELAKIIPEVTPLASTEIQSGQVLFSLFGSGQRLKLRPMF